MSIRSAACSPKTSSGSQTHEGLDRPHSRGTRFSEWFYNAACNLHLYLLDASEDLRAGLLCSEEVGGMREDEKRAAWLSPRISANVS